MNVDTHEINGNEFIVMDNDKKLLDDIIIGEIRIVGNENFVKIKGKIIDLERKCNYTTTGIGTIYDDSIFKVRIHMQSVKNDDTGVKRTQIVITDSNGKVTSIRLCDAKAWKMGRVLTDQFKYETISDSGIIDLPISAETKMFMFLLNSEDGSFIKSDLMKMGIKGPTVTTMIQKLVRTGFIECTGKVGNSNLYTCVVPVEKLKKLFGQEVE